MENKETHALMLLALVGNSTDESWNRCHSYPHQIHAHTEEVLKTTFLWLNFGSILNIIPAWEEIIIQWKCL